MNSKKAILVAATCILCLRAVAQLPAARLSSIFPAGARAGSTVEVAVAGLDLDDATRLVFSDTNIIASAKESAKFIVRVPASVRPGVCDARVIGRFGITNPRAFAIGDINEVVNTTDNKERIAAFEAPVNTTVNGRLDANSVAWFKLNGPPGRRVIIECAAGTIDSRVQPVMILYDAGERELVRSRYGDPIDFRFTSNAPVFLKLHDVLYGGGAEYVYRLTASSRPQIDFVLPAIAAAGSKAKHAVYGRNLPDGQRDDRFGLEKVEAEIDATKAISPFAALPAPAAASVDAFEFRLDGSNGASNPFLISLSEISPVPEQEPNDKPEQAQRITVPCEVSGQFFPANEQDWFSFTGAKGGVYWIEVISHRLWQRSDPFFLLQRATRNEKGETQWTDVKEAYDREGSVGPPEFKITTRDPAFRLEAGEGGEYRVMVRDLFNRLENNPRLIYRLSVRKERPDFHLVALPETIVPPKKDSKEVAMATCLLRRGQTVPVEVIALRQDNFEGEIRVTTDGLPKGVTPGATTILKGKTTAILWLTADTDAATWAGPVQITGKAEVGSHEIDRPARAATLLRSVEDFTKEGIESRFARDFNIAVSTAESAPISIAMAEQRILEARAGNRVKLPLKIVRGAGFTEAFKLKASGVSELESLKEIDVAANATNAMVEIDLSATKLPVGEHTFYLQTQTKGQYRNNPEAAELAEKAAKAAEQLAAELAATVKKVEAVLASADAAGKPEAEKAVAHAKGRAKEAEDRKAATANAAKEAVERAKPREATLIVYSAPIQLRVSEEKKVAAAK